VLSLEGPADSATDGSEAAPRRILSVTFGVDVTFHKVNDATGVAESEPVLGFRPEDVLIVSATTDHGYDVASAMMLVPKLGFDDEMGSSFLVGLELDEKKIKDACGSHVLTVLQVISGAATDDEGQSSVASNRLHIEWKMPMLRMCAPPLPPAPSPPPSPQLSPPSTDTTDGEEEGGALLSPPPPEESEQFAGSGLTGATSFTKSSGGLSLILVGISAFACCGFVFLRWQRKKHRRMLEKDRWWQNFSNDEQDDEETISISDLSERDRAQSSLNPLMMFAGPALTRAPTKSFHNPLHQMMTLSDDDPDARIRERGVELPEVTSRDANNSLLAALYGAGDGVPESYINAAAIEKDGQNLITLSSAADDSQLYATAVEMNSVTQEKLVETLMESRGAAAGGAAAAQPLGSRASMAEMTDWFGEVEHALSTMCSSNSATAEDLAVQERGLARLASARAAMHSTVSGGHDDAQTSATTLMLLEEMILLEENVTQAVQKLEMTPAKASLRTALAALKATAAACTLEALEREDPAQGSEPNEDFTKLQLRHVDRWKNAAAQVRARTDSDRWKDTLRSAITNLRRIHRPSLAANTT